MYQFLLSSFRLTPILVLSLCIYGNCYSQAESKADSLKALLNNSQGIEKFNALYGIAYELLDVNNHEAEEYAEQSYALSWELGDSVSIVKSGRVFGQILRRVDKLNASIDVLLKVYPIAQRNSLTKEEKYILNALALAYTYLANYDKALEYNFKSLVLREKENNKSEICISLNNIGLVYFKLKNYSLAIDYYKRALKIREEIKDYYDLDRLYINLGLCYNQIKDFTESEKSFKKAFEVCNENCSDQILIEGNFGLGLSFFKRDEYNTAKVYFKESYSIAEKTKNKRFLAENSLFLGHVHVANKSFDSAKVEFINAEEIALASGYNEILIESYKELARIFTLTKKYDQSTLYQSKYISLKDSIYSEQLIENVAKIQTQFAQRENIKTIADKEETIQRQRSLNVLIAIIALLAALLIYVLYQSNRVNRKVNKALSEAKAIIEDQNKQLLSSNYSLNEELKEKNIDLERVNESLRRVNDELDNFIYKTSHDIRGPLASLKGMCNVALLDVTDPIALDYLRKLDVTAERMNTILTRLLIVNQINNSVMTYDVIDFKGLVDDVLLLEKKKGLPSKLTIQKDIQSDISFYSDKEFIRIILENLIDNAIKFYNDSERAKPFVNVVIRKYDDGLHIRVIDNGIGIKEVNPEKIFQMFSRASERSQNGGIGLYITKTAAEKLGGTVHLRSTREGFTEFIVKLPMVMEKALV